MAGCLTPSSSEMINDFVCMTSIPRLKCFFFSTSSPRLFLYGFLWFGLPWRRRWPARGGGGPTRAPLYIYEKLLRHVSSPLLPTICYQRLIKMLTNTRDPSCVWRGFLSYIPWACCCSPGGWMWPANNYIARALLLIPAGVRIHTWAWATTTSLPVPEMPLTTRTWWPIFLPPRHSTFYFSYPSAKTHSPPPLN